MRRKNGRWPGNRATPLTSRIFAVALNDLPWRMEMSGRTSESLSIAASTSFRSASSFSWYCSKSLNCSDDVSTRQRSTISPRKPNHRCICIWVSATGESAERVNRVVVKPSSVIPRDITFPATKTVDRLRGANHARFSPARKEKSGLSSADPSLLIIATRVAGRISASTISRSAGQSSSDGTATASRSRKRSLQISVPECTRRRAIRSTWLRYRLSLARRRDPRAAGHPNREQREPLPRTSSSPEQGSQRPLRSVGRPPTKGARTFDATFGVAVLAT